jgi:hypothetical protein
VGHLWTAAGSLLGSVTFSNESSSGWQTALFATPIAISANTTYVASVNSNFAFGATAGSLLTSVRNGSLATVADGRNGVFNKYKGGFPLLASTQSGENYFRDVLFVPS